MVIAILQYWIIVSCNIGISLIESVSGKPADAAQCVLNEAEERSIIIRRDIDAGKVSHSSFC